MPLITVCPIEANPIMTALCDIDLSPGTSALPNKEKFFNLKLLIALKALEDFFKYIHK